MKSKKKGGSEVQRVDPFDVSDLGYSVENVDELHQRAADAISALANNLPAPGGIERLTDLYRELSRIVLNRIWLMQTSDGRRLIHDQKKENEFLLKDVHECTCSTIEALREAITSNPSSFLWIRDRMDWPVLASRDSAIDIRQAGSNPGGPAGRHYHSILSILGEKTWIKPEILKRPSVFRDLALKAAENVAALAQTAKQDRRLHLSSPLDFDDGQKTWRIDGGEPEPTIEWCAAIKYYLYLSLAPTHERQLLRDNWLEKRLKDFRKLRIQGPDAKEYRELREASPIRKGPFGLKATERLSVPRLGITPPKRGWSDWWEVNLQCDASWLFGSALPLHQWSDPKIRKLAGKPGANGSMMSGFGRCVNAILDAYLRLHRYKGGLSTFQLEHKIPMIRLNQINRGG